MLRLRTGWNGDELEIVRPVSANGNPRAAIAWVTIRPTSEFGGSSAAVTAPIVLVSVMIGWIVAILITRSTLRSLNALNEDVELALSGRLDAVADPLGARPVRDLADTISYLVARLRGSGIDTSRDKSLRESASRAAASAPPRPPLPAPASGHPRPDTPRVPHRFRNRPHKIRQRRVQRRASRRLPRRAHPRRRPRLKCWKRV